MGERVRVRAKRPYSMAYTALSNPRRYVLSGIPPTFWEKVTRKARREETSVRALILLLLDRWLYEDDPHGWFKRARQITRASTNQRPPHLKQEFAERKERNRVATRLRKKIRVLPERGEGDVADEETQESQD